MRERGKFVVIEGPDGSGKSTIVEMLKREFKERQDIIFTREPGGTKISEKIRNILLDVDNKEMTDSTEAYLYAAARMQHVEELILPSISCGNHVISDRFVLASICYQGYGREIGTELIEMINKPAEDKLGEIYYIVLMVDAETGIKRKKGQKILDRLEMEKIDFHRRVCDGYLSYKGMDNYIFVDASRSVEGVFSDIIEALNSIGVL